MALPTPTPPQKRVFTPHKNCFFQLSVYICEKPASLAYQERKELQDKPIISHLRPLTQMKYNFIKKLWQIQAQKTKFRSNRKPERTEICVQFLGKFKKWHRKNIVKNTEIGELCSQTLLQWLKDTFLKNQSRKYFFEFFHHHETYFKKIPNFLKIHNFFLLGFIYRLSARTEKNWMLANWKTWNCLIAVED